MDFSFVVLWELKQLPFILNFAQQFLKEILNDLCVYNKRGPNQGTHELKPEYKKSTGDTDAAWRCKSIYL